MQNIITSASKLVLITLVTVLAILSLVAGIHGVLTGQFNDIEKSILGSFGGALSFVFGFYFNTKGDPNMPYGGK